MITITSPSTGKTREIPETIDLPGYGTYEYRYTSPQRNHKYETDWYYATWSWAWKNDRIGRQQPWLLLPFDTTGT